MAAYDIFILGTHSYIFQKEFHIRVIDSDFVEDADVFKKQHASRVFEIHLLAGETEPLTRRTAYKKVNAGQIRCRYIDYISKLYGVGEIVRCLSHCSLVNLGRKILFDLYSGFPQGDGSA